MRIQGRDAGLSAGIARSPCDEAIQFLPSVWLLDWRVASFLAMTGMGLPVTPTLSLRETIRSANAHGLSAGRLCL